MLQITRAMGEYKRVMAATKGDAAVFGAMAKSWMEIKGDVEIFDSHVNAIWAAIASGITPELHKMMVKVNDFTGKLGPAIAGAFQFGKFHILLSDAMMAGLEQASYYGVRIFSAMAVGFGDAVYTALKIALTDFIPMYVNGLKNASKLIWSVQSQNNDMQHVSWAMGKASDARSHGNESSAKDWESAAEKWRAKSEKEATYQDSVLRSGSDYFHAKLADAVKKMTDGMVKGWEMLLPTGTKPGDPNAPHQALDKLNLDMKKLGDAWLSLHPDPALDDHADKNLDIGNHYKPEVTAFQKMGFVMNGGGFNLLKRTEQLLGQIPDKLPPKGSTPTLADIPGYGWLNQI